jgi:hypothetical protein
MPGNDLAAPSALSIPVAEDRSIARRIGTVRRMPPMQARLQFSCNMAQLRGKQAGFATVTLICNSTAIDAI